MFVYLIDLFILFIYLLFSYIAACANEAFKIVTSCAPYLNNYMLYTGDAGVYTHTFELEKKPDCAVCGTEAIKMTLSKDLTLQDWRIELSERRDVQLKNPSLRTASKTLYMGAPEVLEARTRPNLNKTLGELLEGNGEEVTVTDINLPISMQILVTLK